MQTGIEIFDDIDRLGEKFAATLAVRVHQCADRRFFLALSGGRTPEPLLKRLTRPELRAAAPWERVEVFFVDERPVGPDHPDSNYGMVRRAGWPAEACPRPRSTGCAARRGRWRRGRTLRKTACGDRPAGADVVSGTGPDRAGPGRRRPRGVAFPRTAALGETRRAVVANHVPSWVGPSDANVAGPQRRARNLDDRLRRGQGRPVARAVGGRPAGPAQPPCPSCACAPPRAECSVAGPRRGREMIARAKVFQQSIRSIAGSLAGHADVICDNDFKRRWSPSAPAHACCSTSSPSYVTALISWQRWCGTGLKSSP